MGELGSFKVIVIDLIDSLEAAESRIKVKGHVRRADFGEYQSQTVSIAAGVPLGAGTLQQTW